MTPDLSRLRAAALAKRSLTDFGGAYATSPEFDALCNAMGHESACAYLEAANPAVVLALLDEIERLKAEIPTALMRARKEWYDRATTQPHDGGGES